MWKTIRWYRDFYDLPHLLCVEVPGGSLLLDSPMNETTEEYETAYTVKFVPIEPEDADLVIRTAETTDALGTLQLDAAMFDSTKRKQVHIPSELLERLPTVAG